jgi:hypothetical protein
LVLTQAEALTLSGSTIEDDSNTSLMALFSLQPVCIVCQILMYIWVCRWTSSKTLYLSGSANVGSVTATGNITANGVTIGASDVRSMRIDSSGNVGIGATGALTSTYLSKAFVYTAGGANFAIGGSSDTNDAVLSRFTSFNISNSNSGNESSANFYGVTSIESIVVTTDSNAGDDSGGSLLFKTKPEALTSGGALEIGPAAVIIKSQGSFQKRFIDTTKMFKCWFK